MIKNNLSKSKKDTFALMYRRVNGPLMLRYLSMNGPPEAGGPVMF